MKFLLISSLNFQAISSTMYKHQKQALHWMIKRENGDQLPPFWENKNGQYFNSVTIFTTKTKPRSVCGGTVMSTSWVHHKGFYHGSSPWLNLFGLSWWTSFAMVKIKSCHACNNKSLVSEMTQMYLPMKQVFRFLHWNTYQCIHWSWNFGNFS